VISVAAKKRERKGEGEKNAMRETPECQRLKGVEVERRTEKGKSEKE